MSARILMLLAAAGSAALLVGAWTFEYLGHAPCAMCHWQRWPHMAAVLIGSSALLVTGTVTAILGALAVATTAGIGVFHVGVEKKWWPGPSSCTGSGGELADLSGAELLSTDVADKVVMCDQVSWIFLGVSMPGWNALFSLLLMAIWIVAIRRV
ncbi:MAG: disulfide bond formation protein B [Pseudomonadota bacterium]